METTITAQSAVLLVHLRALVALAHVSAANKLEGHAIAHKYQASWLLFGGGPQS